MRLIYVRRWMLGFVAMVVAFAAGSASAGPSSALVPDGQGDFFGTTIIGGTNNPGTIYEPIPVPEPSSLTQSGLGVVVLLIARRKWYGRISA